MTVQEFIDVDSASIIKNTLQFIVSFLIVYTLGRTVVEPSVRRLLSLKNVEPTLNASLQKVTRISIIGGAIIIGLAFAGFTRLLSASATIVAAATLALGIASQDLIGNLVSGVFIVGDKQFNIGDWVEWDGKAGQINDIGFRVTRIRTADNEIITVPNSTLTSTEVTNRVITDTRRVTYPVRIGYDNSVEQAGEILYEVAQEHPKILADPGPKVRLTNFESSGIEMTAHFWIPDPARTDLVQIRSDYGRTIKERFDAADIELYPPSKHDLSGRMQINTESGDPMP